MSETPAPSSTSGSPNVAQATIFWIAIPFFIALQRTLNIGPVSDTMHAMVLVVAFLTILASWAAMHCATLATKAAWLSQGRKIDHDSVATGFLVLIIASVLVGAILIATRHVRADLFCRLADPIEGACYYPPPLSWNGESIRKVIFLTFLNVEYWLFANYFVALLFGVRRYGFRLTHKGALRESAQGDTDEGSSPLIARLPLALGDSTDLQQLILRCTRGRIR